MRITLAVIGIIIAAGGGALAQGGAGAPPGPVRAEISGATRLYTTTGPVIETTEDARFQTERYGSDFTYIFDGVPPGPARMKLGFCENRHTRPRQRLIDIYVADRLLVDNFDILTHGEPNEAVIEAWNITVPEGRPLKLRFAGEVDNAKINLIRIYNADYVLETSPMDERPAIFQPRQREVSASEDVWETQLARLGSRVAINPRPQQGVWWQSPLGHAQYRTAYFDKGDVDFKLAPERYIFGVRVGDVTRSLPFDDRFEHFSQVAQTETMTELSYLCQSPELPVKVRFTWTAPFYPGDARLSTAPWLGLEIEVTGADARQQSGEVIIARSVPADEPLESWSGPGCIGLRRASEVFELPVEEYWCVDGKRTGEFGVYTSGLPVGGEPPAPAATVRRDADGRWVLPLVWDQPYGGLTWRFSVAPGETKRCRIAYIGWADGPVQTINGRPYRFKYHQYFNDPGQVARYAFDDWDNVARRC
ncbi:MAG TPA: malectin domain-containing carbohydrate-binding protein, partial [Armatimonadota bacterium]|nr:malectin domain-containing carbohydrate-binding protein [Armatimonadota bacterium]